MVHSSAHTQCSNILTLVAVPLTLSMSDMVRDNISGRVQPNMMSSCKTFIAIFLGIYDLSEQVKLFPVNSMWCILYSILLHGNIYLLYNILIFSL